MQTIVSKDTIAQQNSAVVALSTENVIAAAGDAMLHSATKKVAQKSKALVVAVHEKKNESGRGGGDASNKLLERLDGLDLQTQRQVEKKTLIRFDRDGRGLARLYRRAGGYVLTPWKRVANKRHVRHGIERWFDANGRVARKRTFCNGRQVDVEQVFVFRSVFQTKPSIAYSCTYVEGNKNGVERLYEVCQSVEGGFEIGPTLRTRQYCNGWQHGKERRESTRTSRLLQETDWVHGLRHGQSVVYFANGKESKRCSYVAGAKNGPMVTKTRQGKCKSVVHYANDLKHGDETRVQQDGKVQVMKWECGVRMQPDTGLPFCWH